MQAHGKGAHLRPVGGCGAGPMQRCGAGASSAGGRLRGSGGLALVAAVEQRALPPGRAAVVGEQHEREDRRRLVDAGGLTLTLTLTLTLNPNPNPESLFLPLIPKP